MIIIAELFATNFMLGGKLFSILVLFMLKNLFKKAPKYHSINYFSISGTSNLEYITSIINSLLCVKYLL